MVGEDGGQARDTTGHGLPGPRSRVAVRPDRRVPVLQRRDEEQRAARDAGLLPRTDDGGALTGRRPSMTLILSASNTAEGLLRRSAFRSGHTRCELRTGSLTRYRLETRHHTKSNIPPRSAGGARSARTRAMVNSADASL